MTRYNDPEYKKLASLRAEARHSAIKRLIAAHPKQFQEFHDEERKTRGLGYVQTISSLKMRIVELERKLGESK